MSQPRHDGPHNEELHDAYIGGEIRRQRRLMMILIVVVVAVVGAVILGVDFTGKSGDTPEGNTSTAANGGSISPNGNGTAADANGVGRKPDRASANGRTPQSAARVVESIVVLAWPTPEILQTGSSIPADRRWLPASIEAIGMDLADRNRALEAGSNAAGWRAMARMGGAYIPEMLRDVRLAAETKHALVVEFNDEGSAWRFHHVSQRKSLVALPWMNWPAVGATSALIAGMVDVVGEMTGYQISSHGVFTQNDEAARAFVRADAAIAKFRKRPSGPDTPLVTVMDTEVESAVAGVLALDAGFDFPVYRRAVMLYDIGLQRQAIDVLRSRVNGGGTSPRMPSLLGQMLAQQNNLEDRAEALKILTAEMEKEPLNMAAYWYWSGIWFSRPEDAEGQVGAVAQAEHGIARYPEDGRYHALLAKELCVNPETAEKAIEYAKQALALRPWNSSIWFHIGMSHFTLNRWDEAAGVFLEYWAYDTNRVETWIELIARSLTKNATTLDLGRAGREGEISERGGFVYMLALISKDLAKAQFGGPLERLFRARQADYEAWLVKRSAEAKPSDPNYVIILMADIALKLAKSGRSELGTTEESRKAVLTAIKRYRDWGGRAPEVERIWQVAVDSGHVGG